MRRAIFCVLFLCSFLFAKEFKLLDYKEYPSDMHGVTNYVLDMNQQYCTVIRVEAVEIKDDISLSEKVYKKEKINSNETYYFICRDEKKITLEARGFSPLELKAPKGGFFAGKVYWVRVKQRQGVVLTFNVNPPEAGIFINNKPFVNGSETEEGEANLKIERQGYESVNETIKVSGQNATFSYTLLKIRPLPVLIKTKPEGAKIILAGEDLGISDKTLQLVPGRYSLTFKKNGYEVLETAINVNAEDDNIFAFTLKQEDSTSISVEDPVFPVSENTPSTDYFSYVEGGTFNMGDTFGWGSNEEKPAHQVTVSSFWIGKKCVSQKEYAEIMDKSNESPNKAETEVTWTDVINFCIKKSIKEGLTPAYHWEGYKVKLDIAANGYRLPTEAEWEFAARGGKKSQNYRYSGSNNYDDVLWYKGNADDYIHEMGLKQPNELGLYDMNGNIWEWTYDDYSKFTVEPQTNPIGGESNNWKVLKGGDISLDYDKIYVFVRKQGHIDHRSFSFRLARSH